MGAKFSTSRACDIHKLTYWNTHLDADAYDEITEAVKMENLW